MDRLLKKEPRDVWDDLMEKIDLSGCYETFINPSAIEAIVRENERLAKDLAEAINLLQGNIPVETGKVISQALEDYRNKDSEHG